MTALRTRADVWAVVVHFGDLGATVALLSALRSGSLAPDRVVVIDNQGDLELAEDATVGVRRPGHNSGFGAAAAAGFAAALEGGAAWVWLLNNDAEPAPDCLERLLAAGAAAPRAGLLSPVIRYREGGGWWYAGGAVSARTLSVRHATRPARAQPYATGFVTGCAPLFRAALAQELQPLDRGFFLYYEDVDWSLRAARRGWELLVVPDAVVTHDVPRAAGRRVFSDDAVYYMTRNRLLLAREHGRVVPAAAAGTLWAARQAVKRGSWPAAASCTRSWAEGLRDGLAARRGPRR